MDGICSVLPLRVVIPKVRKVRSKGIAVKEDNVMRVHSADSMVDAIVKSSYACMAGIGWLIEWIVTCNPCVITVVFCEFLP